jgi:hypothetical protein
LDGLVEAVAEILCLEDMHMAQPAGRCALICSLR